LGFALRQVLRFVLIALRSIPELIWALIFVRVVGLGPTAGVLAIALTYGGMLGKVYGEILESGEAQATTTLLQNGSGRLQAFFYGLLPQNAAELTSYTVYRWECAIRSSVVLGFVGAGGLGQFGIQYLRSMTDAHVIVADTSPGKRARALELGAHEVCDTAELEGPLDGVFDYVGADATLAVANRIIRRGGLVVNVGAYGGSIPFGFSLVPHETWWTQSMWGSRDDLAAVIRIAQRGDLQYSVERLPLEAAADAHRRIKAGDVDGRLVLVP
jgi:NADPH:quinone reductase-like Zn-dependent oxidoreductase